jgi:uncharacterized protein (DUF1330 family)
MPAYIISDVTFRDPAAVEAYRKRAAASIAHHGGRYLVRGGNVETWEGSWSPSTLVIVEFPDADRAREWYRSAEYAEALQFREAALTRDLVLVEGVAA